MLMLQGKRKISLYILAGLAMIMAVALSIICIIIFPVFFLKVNYNIPVFFVEITVWLEENYILTQTIAKVVTFLIFFVPAILLGYCSKKISDYLWVEELQLPSASNVAPETVSIAAEKENEAIEEDTWQTVEMFLRVAIIIVATIAIIYLAEFLIDIDMKKFFQQQ